MNVTELDKLIAECEAILERPETGLFPRWMTEANLKQLRDMKTKREAIDASLARIQDSNEDTVTFRIVR